MDQIEWEDVGGRRRLMLEEGEVYHSSLRLPTRSNNQTRMFLRFLGVDVHVGKV
jgi:hypothetical protein